MAKLGIETLCLRGNYIKTAFVNCSLHFRLTYRRHSESTMVDSVHDLFIVESFGSKYNLFRKFTISENYHSKRLIS